MSSFYRDLTDSLHNTVAEYMNDVEVLDDEQEQEVVEVKQALQDVGRMQRDLRLLEQRCMDATMRGLNEVKAMLQEEVHLRHSSERRLEERCDRIDRELAGAAARDRQEQPISQQLNESLRSHTRRLEETNRMLQEEVHLRNVAEKLLEERCDKIDLALAALQANSVHPSREGTVPHQVQHRLDCLEVILRESVEKLTTDIETARQQGPVPLRDFERTLTDVNHMLQDEIQMRTSCERHLQERIDDMERQSGIQKDVQAKLNDLKSDATTAHQRIDCLEAIVEEAHGRFTKELQGVSNQLVQQQPLPAYQQAALPHQQQGPPPSPLQESQRMAPVHQQFAAPEFQQPGLEKQPQQQQPVMMQPELQHAVLNQLPQELLPNVSEPVALPMTQLPPQAPRTFVVTRSPSARSLSREVRDVRAPSPIRQASQLPVQILLQQQVSRQPSVQVGVPCESMSGQRPPEVRYVL